MEFKSYPVALWGNKKIIIATDYSARSVCIGGTEGSIRSSVPEVGRTA